MSTSQKRERSLKCTAGLMENGWFPLVDASVTQDIRRRAGCVKVSDAVGNCATASSFVDVCFCVGLTHLYWTSLVFQQSAVLHLTSDSLMMHRDILCRVINITVVIIYRIIVRWILNSFPVIICWGVGLKIFHAALTQHHSLLITDCLLPTGIISSAGRMTLFHGQN